MVQQQMKEVNKLSTKYNQIEAHKMSSVHIQTQDSLQGTFPYDLDLSYIATPCGAFQNLTDIVINQYQAQAFCAFKTPAVKPRILMPVGSTIKENDFTIGGSKFCLSCNKVK